MIQRRPSRVFVGVDESLGSLQALRRAAAEARHRHVDLYVVHVRSRARSASLVDSLGQPIPGGWLEPPRTDWLNASALQSGNVAQAIARNVPVTVDRHIYVSQTDGNTAVVHDDLTLKGQAGTFDEKHTYAVDRTKLTEATPPAGVQVENHQGLTISLPASPDPKSHVYKYWDPATRVAVPVRYTGSAKREGRETFHYEA